MGARAACVYRNWVINPVLFITRLVFAPGFEQQCAQLEKAMTDMEAACMGNMNNVCNRVRTAPVKPLYYVPPQALHGVVKALRAPRMRVVILHGQPGLGKAALAEDVRCRAHSGVCFLCPLHMRARNDPVWRVVRESFVAVK